METNRVDGKAIARDIILKLANKAKMQQKKICFVILHSTSASETFVKMKLSVARQIGIHADVLRYAPSDTDDAIRYMRDVADQHYDGIVVQLPLTEHFDTQQILNTVSVEQDIDLLSDAAKISFAKNKASRMPPVAFAVWTVLEKNNIDLATKKILVVGQGKLVGEPVCALFDTKHISYDAIDKNTDIEAQKKLLQEADIIISGIGVPRFIQSDMIKDGVILIDAGTSEQAGKLTGDIDPTCYEKASLYTPVPGGIGPITVAGLFWNLFLK